MLFRCTLCFGILLSAACRLQPTERNVHRSFYYWKTKFALDSSEKQALQQHNVRKLYLRFFDADWDALSNDARPAGKLQIAQVPPTGILIVPVVYITQEVLQRSDSAALRKLASRIATLITSQAEQAAMGLADEVQVDCDWTATTRDRYFYLLEELRDEPLLQGRKLTATIRMHQLKYRGQTGVPPVDRGLLMCYNMGNLKDPSVNNSIIDPEEVSRYIGGLSSYPLPLDIALPIFDWWVLFDRNEYRGLVRDFRLQPPEGENRIAFARDTTINGYGFKAGQWLRHETSPAPDVLLSAQKLSRKLKMKDITVILYHLDSANLANYSPDDLESFYRCFR